MVVLLRGEDCYWFDSGKVCSITEERERTEVVFVINREVKFET